MRTSLTPYQTMKPCEPKFPGSRRDSSSPPCHVRAVIQYYLLLKRIHRRASYNLSQFTPFRLLAVVSLREPVCTTVAVTTQHVRVPWGSASRSRIRKRG